ncbi:DUF309 domain-containing protein [Streptomyces sp. NRRL S-87]|uniref:DUF309 domain-containing protein n=1 Tax=Streptomyces sp. NRRL S-87 TaxID=1463920 RepID=UPI0004C134CC|nr:DUF309 domain-containing protein [Streptomyces sp. NRRL S-87]
MERDRDGEGRARSARPRDGLGRPLPYGAEGVERQPEGVVRSPDDTVREAQRLLDAGMPFHAHEVFEDAWKSGPAEEAGLWRALAQLAVGLTHAARGNATGGARLLLRGAQGLEEWRPGRAAAPGPGSGPGPYGLDLVGLVGWARELGGRVAAGGGAGAAPVDAGAEAPRLRGVG